MTQIADLDKNLLFACKARLMQSDGDGGNRGNRG